MALQLVVVENAVMGQMPENGNLPLDADEIHGVENGALAVIWVFVVLLFLSHKPVLSGTKNVRTCHCRTSWL